MTERNIYLVRHLATEYNHSGVFMGRSFDMPIKEEGIKKFKSTIKKIDWENISSAYTSPSLRCIQTLEILKNELEISSVSTNTNLNFQEANYGEFEGKNAKEVKLIYPKELEQLTKNPSEVKFPNGESFTEVQERAYKGLQEIISNLEEESSAIICTHVDIVKMILFKILDISIDKKRYIHINNGSISCLDLAEEGIKVKFMNLT